MTHEARWMIGITLLTVPTIVYGGLTLLGALTGGHAGLHALRLEPLQQSLFRAAHAHAGVLLLLSLVLQLALDATGLGPAWRWAARVAAPLAAVLVSAGFFGTAFVPGLRAVLYLGAALAIFAALVTGIGLLAAAGGR